MAGIWYRLGTVALTQNSKRVTGTGTQWLDQATGPTVGNTFWGPDNKPYEVERVVDNTKIDLVEAYTGATVSGAAYKIVTPEKASVAALASQVAATLQYAQAQYANMSTWAASDLSADVPVILPDGVNSKNIPNLAKMSAATAAKLTETPQLKALDVPSTAFGRARLNDADGPAALTALGASVFGQARLKDADAAAARLALALGTAAQRAAQGNGALLSVDSVIGLVAQVGGVNTGAIVEVGENANGMYIKYAGGLMIAIVTVTISAYAVTSAAGPLFQSSTIINASYPVTFVRAVRSFLEVRYDGGGARPWAAMTSQGVSSSAYVLQSPLSMASFSGALHIGVVGFWY